jgi:ferritin-like metal-binding protein YciE
MQINSFKEMYFAELSELVDAEKRLVEALTKAAEKASHDGLKQALLKHRDETQTQRDRVRAILDRHGYNPDAHQDQAMASLIAETEKMQDILQPSDLADAGLIASAQKIEHYEIAAYGTAAAYAGVLGLTEDQSELHTILDEEKATDQRLSLLATTVVNQDAINRAA